MGTLFVDKLDPQSGTSLEIGSSGDTITIPAGATITNNGTQTGFGGTMTPAFFARLTTVQSLTANTLIKIQFDTEDFDTNTAYDNATNYRFTVPAGEGGKYYFYASGYFVPGAESNLSYAQVYLVKNGTIYQGTNSDFRAGRIFTFTQHCAGIMDLSAGDYVEAYVYTSGTSTVTLEDDNGRVDRFNVFYGYKIIE